MFCAVDAHAVDGVSRNEPLNPAIPQTPDFYVFGPEIGQGDDVVSLPAKLDRGLVVVVYRAVWVKILGLLHGEHICCCL